MQRRRLGGLEVSAVGLGCATMTPFYDEPDRDAAIETLRCAPVGKFGDIEGAGVAVAAVEPTNPPVV
jgi:hypothetical protein